MEGKVQTGTTKMVLVPQGEVVERWTCPVHGVIFEETRSPGGWQFLNMHPKLLQIVLDEGRGVAVRCYSCYNEFLARSLPELEHWVKGG